MFTFTEYESSRQAINTNTISNISSEILFDQSENVVSESGATLEIEDNYS